MRVLLLTGGVVVVTGVGGAAVGLAVLLAMLLLLRWSWPRITGGH